MSYKVQGFPTSPKLEFPGYAWDSPRNGKHAILLDDFMYIDKNGRTHTAPAGFRTDGGTVTGFFHIVGTPYRNYLAAYIIHDYECDIAEAYKKSNHEMYVTLRRDADDLFMEMLVYLKAGTVKRWLMYRGVRVGARF